MIVLLVWLLPLPCLAMDDIEKKMEELSHTIGAYPPSINSQQEFLAIKEKYDAVKQLLDNKVNENSHNLAVLLQRGNLQDMGHNADIPGAWEGAEKDFLTILHDDPKNTDAMTALGKLYINSDPRLAPKAQELFEKAQKLHGMVLLEDVQRGLYFAYYYQGKICQATKQAQILVSKWPDDKSYPRLLETVQSVLDRTNTVCH